jgi:D-sedoheptulose 7-phosphate isomerase
MSDAYSFADYAGLCHRLIDSVPKASLNAVCDTLFDCYRLGRTVFVCGNGGSAANASHFSEDLAKLMWDEATGRRLRVLSLCESTPLITALANDDGYARIFEIQLATQAMPGDALLCISGSGNSPNVLRAVAWANRHDLHTVALTGYSGGELGQQAAVHLHLPSQNMGMLECVHMLLLDYISKELRYRAYGTAHAER